jgi:hypothetical protein
LQVFGKFQISVVSGEHLPAGADEQRSDGQTQDNLEFPHDQKSLCRVDGNILPRATQLPESNVVRPRLSARNVCDKMRW